MAYWLMKSEPASWSWDDQVRDGIAEWDGVRNFQAANNMKAMKRNDKAFFYHSINEKRIVGIVSIAREYYPDPTERADQETPPYDDDALPETEPCGDNNGKLRPGHVDR